MNGILRMQSACVNLYLLSLFYDLITHVLTFLHVKLMQIASVGARVFCSSIRILKVKPALLTFGYYQYKNTVASTGLSESVEVNGFVVE